jgi:hypothetical protein
MRLGVQRRAKMRASLHAVSIGYVQTIEPLATPFHQLSGLLGAAERAWFPGAAARHWISRAPGNLKTKPRRPSLLSAFSFFADKEILRQYPPETHPPRAEAPRRATQRERL